MGSHRGGGVVIRHFTGRVLSKQQMVDQIVKILTASTNSMTETAVIDKLRSEGIASSERSVGPALAVLRMNGRIVSKRCKPNGRRYSLKGETDGN